MITRRGFLKLLSSLPGVAALPTTAAVLEKVEAEVAPTPEGPLPSSGGAKGVNSWWLRLNGTDVAARSVTQYEEQAYWKGASFYSDKALLYLGLRDTRLQIEMYGMHEDLHTAMALCDTVLLEYSPYAGLVFRAEAVISRFDRSFDPGVGFIERVTMLLRDGRWEAL